MNATALGKLFLVPTPLDFLCDTLEGAFAAVQSGQDRGRA